MGMEFFIDTKAGTVLGRTAMSWAKISLFYLIYYSLLGALSYFSVTYYQENRIKKVGDMPEIGNKRLDQPGVVPHPHAHWLEERNQEINFGDGDVADKYDQQMDLFLRKYEGNDAHNYCLAEGDSLTQTCRIHNADAWNIEKVRARREAKQPVVFLTVNKIVGWTPLRQKKTALDVKDRIGFECFEIDGLDGKKVEDSKFTVRPVEDENNVMNPNAFPFPGKSDKDFVWNQDYTDHSEFSTQEGYDSGSLQSHRYQQPFVVVEAVPNDETAWGDEIKFFRCKVLADNIQTFDATEDKSYDENLRKMSLGFVEWGFGY